MAATIVRKSVKDTSRLLLSMFGHTHGHVGCPACEAKQALAGKRTSSSNSTENTDYAFEMAASNVRYGLGVTREIGLDLKNLRSKNVLVMTDPIMKELHPVKIVEESLTSVGINYTLYSKVRVEPSDNSFKEAIDFARKGNFDAYVAVGGGSVIDTCKAANLYATYPEADLLEFVNAPIGKGRPVDRAVKPLIAVPTTAGTGSETTGTAIFDFKEMKAKTGITSRAIKPLLGIIDPLNTQSMPRSVRLASGLDVLCHALESYTTLPYYHRSPRPTNPIDRPGYQGANPISDIWSLHALKMTIEQLPLSVKNLDEQSNEQMVLAATYAGVGFGNAGVHLCHGLSYPISGLNRTYKQDGYRVQHPLVPHGISVAITAPAVFKFTASSNPDRHLEAAKLFGANVNNAKRADAGLILSEALRHFLQDLGVPNGISALGFTSSDIPALVKGALPQRRLLNLSPHPVASDELSKILEESIQNY